MSEAVEPQKSGKVSREEFLARMAEGRRKARERREREREQPPPQPQAPATDFMDHGGQTLRKTNAKEIKSKQNGRRRLEDIAQRHVARDAGLVDTPSDYDTAPEPDEELPSRDARFHGIDDAIPAPAVKPELREWSTAMPDLAAEDGSIRNLNDLMEVYGGALLAGTCFVRVERLRPISHDGAQIKGVQRRIQAPITEQDFEDIYGGGTYELIVYGPSERGHRLGADGRTLYRKKTRPLVIVVPLGRCPPNIDALVEEEDEEHDMQPNLPVYRGVRRTNADANIHSADLAHEERREERARRDQRERIEDERKRRDEAERQSMGAIGELTRTHERTLDALQLQHGSQLKMLQSQLSATERRLEEIMKSDASKPTESMIVADLAKTSMQTRQSDPEELRRIQADAAASREQLTQRHLDEIRNLRDQQRQEIERLERQMDDERKRAEERNDTTRRTCDERIREIQQQANDRVNEAEKRADRDVAHAKEDGDRRVRDLQQNYEARINDMERNHKRDLSTKDDSYASRRESLENTHAMQMSTKDSEVSRLREENDKLRSEANKPLGERMQEFNDTAEAMGFSKGDGAEEKDWRSALAEGGIGLLGQLPELARTITQTLQSRQSSQAARPGVAAALAGVPQPQQLPPPIQGRGGGIAASRDLGWATEDGPPLAADDEIEFDSAVVPGQAPIGPTRRPIFDGDSGTLRPMQASHPPPQNIAPQRAQPTAQIVPVQKPPPPPSTQQDQTFDIGDDHIVEYARGLQQAFDQGATPQEYVEYTKEQLGPDMVQAITSSLDPDRIVRVLQQKDPSNSLVRRDGIKFMQAVWRLAQMS